MSDIRSLLGAATATFGGGDEARFEAELLLAHALGKTRAWLYAWPDLVPDAASAVRFAATVDARAAGRPIAYLTGRREFWSLDLAVDSAVLIPRPDTERLVELALNLIPADAPCAVADLGTGSGAIALAIASERPRATVLATDCSRGALAVARSNAGRLGITNVDFAQGDWCGALGPGRFDVVVSNPPYIALDDAHLGRGDLRHEPPGALASGVDGLDAIRAILAHVAAHLVPSGHVLIEHGFDQGPAVRALFAASGFADIVTSRDAGARERVTHATLAA